MLIEPVDTNKVAMVHVVEEKQQSQDEEPAFVEFTPSKLPTPLTLAAQNISSPPKSISFSERSAMYQWIKRGIDPKLVTELTIQDGWMRLNLEFIKGEHFEDKDIAYIAKTFTNLRCIKFTLNSEMTDNALNSLASLSQLRQVSLAGVHQLTDNGLLILAKNHPQLESLVLGGGLYKLRGETLKEALMHLRNLSFFSITNTDFNLVNCIPRQTVTAALQGTTIKHLELVEDSYDIGRGREAESEWEAAFRGMPELCEVILTRLKAYQGRTILNAISKTDASVSTLHLNGTRLDGPLPPCITSLTYTYKPDQIDAVIEWAKSASELEVLILNDIPTKEYQFLEFAEGFSSLRELHFNYRNTIAYPVNLINQIKSQRPTLAVYRDGVLQ